MFVDEIKFFIQAGKGGDGIVSWRHEKFKEFGGPSGGDGGNGGDVYAKAVRDISILFKYKNIKEFKAENGERGKSDCMKGKNGEDLEILLPIGSVITNLETGKKFSLLEEDERILLLKGGRGGLGNDHFKSSTNVRPTEFTLGKEGESAKFFIELELFADIGLVGLPNAGKSSLVSALTRSSSKVGDYPFTTLEPSLGNIHGYIMADIPGLIEGSSKGKGLGHKFLRHIKRTKILLHCISSENKDITKVYNIIRKELGDFDKTLLEKDEILVITKTDLLNKEELKIVLKEVKKIKDTVYSVSVLDDDLLKNFKDEVIKILRN